MKSPSTIRSFLWGIVGLALAFFAQRQVDPKSLTTAAVLFIGAAALCIWAFRQNDQSAETSALKSADSGANVWLGIALAVVRGTRHRCIFPLLQAG